MHWSIDGPRSRSDPVSIQTVSLVRLAILNPGLPSIMAATVGGPWQV